MPSRTYFSRRMTLSLSKSDAPSGGLSDLMATFTLSQPGGHMNVRLQTSPSIAVLTLLTSARVDTKAPFPMMDVPPDAMTA